MIYLKQNLIGLKLLQKYWENGSVIYSRQINVSLQETSQYQRLHVGFLNKKKNKGNYNLFIISPRLCVLPVNEQLL